MKKSIPYIFTDSRKWGDTIGETEYYTGNNSKNLKNSNIFISKISIFRAGILSAISDGAGNINYPLADRQYSAKIIKDSNSYKSNKGITENIMGLKNTSLFVSHKDKNIFEIDLIKFVIRYDDKEISLKRFNEIDQINGGIYSPMFRELFEKSWLLRKHILIFLNKKPTKIQSVKSWFRKKFLKKQDLTPYGLEQKKYELIKGLFGFYAVDRLMENEDNCIKTQQQ